MKKARGMHTASMLENGSILVMGGSQSYQHFITMNQSDIHPVRSGEIFDPLMEMSFELPYTSFFDRVNSSATNLEGKRVLIIGGKGPDASMSAALFDYSF